MQKLRIAIVGTGYAGTALAAHLHRLISTHTEIILIDKQGEFAVGDAYRTPYPFHLLNVRAEEMSLFEDSPNHFVHWIKNNKHARKYVDESKPLEQQFVPRLLYRWYLQAILKNISNMSNPQLTVKYVADEVTHITQNSDDISLALKRSATINVDKVVLAIGNPQPCHFPFPINGVHCIENPWDFISPSKIPKNQDVCIIGTGLSMIDVVLTLHHHGHQGNILAVSRHGLLPLPHHNSETKLTINPKEVPQQLISIFNFLREQAENQIATGNDWRVVINGFNPHVSQVWQQLSVRDKKRFLRHLSPYWNVHRHRVHNEIADLLVNLQSRKQLEIVAGRVLNIENGIATIRLRPTKGTKGTKGTKKTKGSKNFKVDCLINCMGPTTNLRKTEKSLIHSLLHNHLATLDPLNLGLKVASNNALMDIDDNISKNIFSLGPPCKGIFWANSVPEIRPYCAQLAKEIVGA